MRPGEVMQRGSRGNRRGSSVGKRLNKLMISAGVAVPDLPGCMSDGETPEEALANVRDAVAAWIEEAHELGRSVSQPSCRHVAAE
jgi:predicted RNase H-like HicB family nuclease